MKRLKLLLSLGALFTPGSLLAMSHGQADLVTKEKPTREMLTLPILVFGADGKPVVRAVVIPLALGSSQGHGRWSVDGYGHSEPPTLMTDAEGRANVPYPRYVDERLKTTEVTLSVDHPDYPLISRSIKVPRQEHGPHLVTLQQGMSVEIEPLQDGKPAALEGLHAIWSDGRSWKPGVSLTVTNDGALRIPPMPPALGQVLIVRLEGKRATHFSGIIELQLQRGATARERVELHPAVRIEGALSDNVPRPVGNGRVKARTLPKEDSSHDIFWCTWVPITKEGKFVIDAWPAGEPAQLIALCDGYIAESGDAPDVIKETRSPGGSQWPQVFSPRAQSGSLVLRMTPLIRCVIETVDEKALPLMGVEVQSFPNVWWWNRGTQVYCWPLVRGERLLLGRDYRKCVDGAFSLPFKTVTDASGRGEFELPVGREDLFAEHDEYELPIVCGERIHQVRLVANQTTTVRLALQPKGIEHLGEWDNLADHYGKIPPEWHVSDAKGVKKNVTLADFNGKWVFLAFWGFG